MAIIRRRVTSSKWNILRDHYLSHRRRMDSKKQPTGTASAEEERAEDVKTWSWFIDIQEAKDQVPRSHGGHSIFKVSSSRYLFLQHPIAFFPQVVSIGPYHHGKPYLREMEKHKRRIVLNMINRTGCDLEALFQLMANLESKTRDCYNELGEKYKREEFVKMMLLDACFILELLRYTTFQSSLEPSEYSADDPIFTPRGISPYIQRDLLMLENQLPLFVLNDLFDFISEEPRTKDQSVAKFAIDFFNSVIPCLSETCINPDQLPHILDVVRRSMLPEKATVHSVEVDKEFQNQSDTQSPIARPPGKVSSADPEANEEEKSQNGIVMHSVMELRSTGIKFRKKKSTKLLDIEFDKGVLYIPPLVIDGSTKSIFLNLMAFEQFYPHCNSHFISYVSFMDGLIDSPKDVEYLKSKGIIEHSFGNEEDVAVLFNNLRREIVFDTNDYYLDEVSKALHKHSQQKLNTWMATLRQEYLKNPWKVISIAAAAFLILLTVAQVAYAVLSYHFPSS